LESDQIAGGSAHASLTKAADAQKGALQDVWTWCNRSWSSIRRGCRRNHDLLQAGGNVHQRIQKMMRITPTGQQPCGGPTAASPLTALHGLAEKSREWLALRKKERFLQFAATQATATAGGLSEQRQKLATQLETSKSGAAASTGWRRIGRPAGGTPTAAAPGSATPPQTNPTAPDTSTTSLSPPPATRRRPETLTRSMSASQTGAS